MKNSFLLMSLIGVMLFSCKKTASDNLPASIEGTWKMILVRDNATNATITKPASIQGDVIITFVSNSDTTGLFSGNTPSNVFTGVGVWSNTYTLGPNQTISIPALSMTKIRETFWGNLFVDNITKAQQYSFGQGGQLNIRTINKTLIFKKQ